MPSRRGGQGSAAQVVAQPRNVGIFFAIYFIMTGLHGLHVIGGMGVIAWVLRRALRGEFGGALLQPGRFHRAVLALRRPGVDFPVPVVVPDPLRIGPTGT